MGEYCCCCRLCSSTVRCACRVCNGAVCRHPSNAGRHILKVQQITGRTGWPGKQKNNLRAYFRTVVAAIHLMVECVVVNIADRSIFRVDTEMFKITRLRFFSEIRTCFARIIFVQPPSIVSAGTFDDSYVMGGELEEVQPYWMVETGFSNAQSCVFVVETALSSRR